MSIKIGHCCFILHNLGLKIHHPDPIRFNITYAVKKAPINKLRNTQVFNFRQDYTQRGYGFTVFFFLLVSGNNMFDPPSRIKFSLWFISLCPERFHDITF